MKKIDSVVFTRDNGATNVRFGTQIGYALTEKQLDKFSEKVRDLIEKFEKELEK